MPIRTEMSACRSRRICYAASAIVLALSLTNFSGCGAPSMRQLENRRELEALLTAISLKNMKELGKDAQRIEDRRARGELSEASYRALEDVLKSARNEDWSGAEKKAYELRESKPYFD